MLPSLTPPLFRTLRLLFFCLDLQSTLGGQDCWGPLTDPDRPPGSVGSQHGPIDLSLSTCQGPQKASVWGPLQLCALLGYRGPRRPACVSGPFEGPICAGLLGFLTARGPSMQTASRGRTGQVTVCEPNESRPRSWAPHQLSVRAEEQLACLMS